MNVAKPITAFVALAGGFVLSFAGVGALWIGAAWHYQALMFFPFLLLSFVVTRTSNGQTYLLAVFGALPLAVLLSMFRDSNDSHLMSMLMVLTWLVGILGGHQLADRFRRTSRLKA